MTERWCILHGLLLYTYFTTINGAVQSASSYYADTPLPYNVNTVWYNRRGLRPAESFLTWLPARQIGPTLQQYNGAVTSQNDRNIFAPATITNAITHTCPIAINKVPGEFAPAEKLYAKTQPYPIANNKILGEYVYPYKPTATNAPVHACLAGYDGEIFKIIEDIKETTGFEIEVHFYLFYNCKFNILGSYMTNVKNLQDVLSKYHHYICLNKKYVDTMYKPKEHCWYIEKLIVIPSFHNEVDLLHKDLQVQDFSKMCYRNEFKPLVIEVEEKFDNLAKKNEEEIICLRDINKIYDKTNEASISNNIYDSNALKHNQEYMNWKFKNKAHSESNSNAFIQPVALKFTTPTVPVTSYGPYTQLYAKNRDALGNTFEDNKSHDEKLCNSGQNNVLSSNVIYNSQNSFSNYVKGLNVVTAAPVCSIISNYEQAKGNVDVVNNRENVSPNIVKLLPVNSQGKPCVVSENDKIEIVNSNTSTYQTSNQMYYTENQNQQSYWNQNTRKGVICNNVMSGQNINYGSNNRYPVKSVVFQQNDINSSSASSVIITPAVSTAVSSNQQHTQLATNITPNYSLISNAMATPQTKIYVSQLAPNIASNILQSKIPSYTSTTAIPSHSDVVSNQPPISTTAIEVPVNLQQNKLVPNVQPSGILKLQPWAAVQPLQTISSYTPLQSTLQPKLFASYVQTSEVPQVQPTETFQPPKVVQPGEATQPSQVILSYTSKQPKQLTPYIQSPNILSMYNPYQSAYIQKQFAPYIEVTYFQSPKASNVQSSEAVASYKPFQSGFSPSAAEVTEVNAQSIPQFVSSLTQPNLIAQVQKNTANITTSYDPSQSHRYQEFIASQLPSKPIFVAPLNSRPCFVSMIHPQNHASDFMMLFKQPNLLIGDQKSNSLLNKGLAFQYSHTVTQSSLNDPQSITDINCIIPSEGRPKNKLSSYQTTTSDTPVNVNIITSKDTNGYKENNQGSMTNDLPFEMPNVKPVLPISSKGVLNLLADTYSEHNQAYSTMPYASTAARTNPILLTSYTHPESSTVEYKEVFSNPSSLPFPPQDATSLDPNMSVGFDTKIYTDQNVESICETTSSFPTKGIPSNLNVISEFTPVTEKMESAKLLDKLPNQPTRPPKVGLDTISVEPEQLSEAQMTLVPSYIPTSTGIFPSTQALSQKISPNIEVSNYIRQPAPLPSNLVYIDTYKTPLVSQNIVQKNVPQNIILPYSCINKIHPKYNIWSSLPFQSYYETKNIETNTVSPYKPSPIKDSTNIVAYTPRPKQISLAQRPKNFNILQSTYIKHKNVRPIISRPCSKAETNIFTPYVSNFKFQNIINTYDPCVGGIAKSPKHNIKVQPVTYEKLFRPKFVSSTQTTPVKSYDNLNANTPPYNELTITYKEAIPSTQRVSSYVPYKENFNVIHSYTKDPPKLPYMNWPETIRYPRLKLAAKVHQRIPITSVFDITTYTRPKAIELAKKQPYTNVCQTAEYQNPKVKILDNIPIKTNEKYVCINSYIPAQQATDKLRGIPIVEPIQPLHVSVNAGLSNLPIGRGNVRNYINDIIPNVDIVEPATIKQSALNVINQHKKKYEYITTYAARPVNANKEIHSPVKLVPCADDPRSAREGILEITNYTPYLNKATAAFRIPYAVSDLKIPNMVSYNHQKDSSQTKSERPKGIVNNIPFYQPRGSNLIHAVHSNQYNKLEKKPEYYQFIDSYSKRQLPNKQVFADIATPEYISRQNFKNIPCTKINPNIISKYLQSSNFDPYSRLIPIKIENYKTDRKSQTNNIKYVQNDMKNLNLITNYINPRQPINILSYSQPCTEQTNTHSKTIPRYKQITSNLRPQNQEQFVNIQSYTKPDPKVCERVSTYTTSSGNEIMWLKKYTKPGSSGQNICDTSATYSKGSSILSIHPSCKKSNGDEIPVTISSYVNPKSILCTMPTKMPTQSTYTPVHIYYTPHKNYLSSVKVSTHTDRQSSGISANFGPRASSRFENYDNILSYTPRNQHGVSNQANKYMMQPQVNTIASYIQPKKDEKCVTVEAYTKAANQNFGKVAHLSYINKKEVPHQKSTTYRDTITKQFITIDSNRITQKYKPIISYYKPGFPIHNQPKLNRYTNLQCLTHKTLPTYENILRYQTQKDQAYQSIIWNSKPCISANTVDKKISEKPVIRYSEYIPMKKVNYVKPLIQYGLYMKPNVFTYKYTTNNIITNYQTITPQRCNTVLYYNKPQSILRQDSSYTSPQRIKVQPYCTMASTPYMTAALNLVTTNEKSSTIAKTMLESTKTSTASILTIPDMTTTCTKYPKIDMTKYYEISRVPNNISYEPYTETFSKKSKTPAKIAEKFEQIPVYQNHNNIQTYYDTIPEYTKPLMPLMEYIQKYKTNTPKTVYNEISTYTTVPKEKLQISNIYYEPQDFKTVYKEIRAKTKIKPVYQEISSYTPLINNADPIKNVQSIGWYENTKTNNHLVYTPLVHLVKNSSNEQSIKNIEQYQILPTYTKHDFGRKVSQICPNLIFNLKQNSLVTPYVTKSVTPCYIKSVTPCYAKKVSQIPQIKTQSVPYYTVAKKGFTNGHHPSYIPQTIMSNVVYKRPQIVPWISQIQAQVIPHYTVNQKQSADKRNSHVVMNNILNNRPQTVPGYYVSNRHNTVTQKWTTNLQYLQYGSTTNKLSRITQQKVQNIPRYTVTQKLIPIITQYSPCVTNKLIYNRPQMAQLKIQQKMQTVPYYTVTQKETTGVRYVPCDTQTATTNILYKNHHQIVPSYTSERAINVPYYTTQIPNIIHQPSISSTNVLYNQNDKPKSWYTQGEVYQAPCNTTSKVEVQNFVQCLQSYITRYINCNPQFKETLNNIYDNAVTFETPLSSISLLNCKFDNKQSFAVRQMSNNIEIRGYLNKVKIIKPKMVFETEEVEVPNFVPIVKGRQIISNDIVQNYVRNSLSDKYNFLIVNKSCPVTGKCVMNWDSRGGGKKAIIWPSTYVHKK